MEPSGVRSHLLAALMIAMIKTEVNNVQWKLRVGRMLACINLKGNDCDSRQKSPTLLSFESKDNAYVIRELLKSRSVLRARGPLAWSMPSA